MSKFFNRNPPFVKIGNRAKEIIKENKIKIKEINKEIQRLFDNDLDTTGYIRKELNRNRRQLMNENTKIRKGFITISDNDTSAKNIMDKLYNNGNK